MKHHIMAIRSNQEEAAGDCSDRYRRYVGVTDTGDTWDLAWIAASGLPEPVATLP